MFGGDPSISIPFEFLPAIKKEFIPCTDAQNHTVCTSN